MFSTWLGLSAATRGLAAAQRGLDTAGHNITNANTPGFSRQRINLQATRALAYPSLISITPGQIGQGVDITSVTRIRDSFLDGVYRRQNSNFSQFEAQTLAFSQLEAVLQEPSDTGIGTLLGEFFGAWNNVANTPESRPTRTALLQTTDSLLLTFRQVEGQLDQLSREQDVQINAAVTDANRIIDQVADLNRQISAVEASGQNANDLEDQRDLLIDELSTIIPISVQNEGNGLVGVLVGGTKVVSATRGIHLETYLDPDKPGTKLQVRFRETRTPAPIEDGRLQGLFKMRDEILPEIEDKLNQLASTLVNRINQTHRQHYGLDGVNGRAYFTEIITQSRKSAGDLAAQFPALPGVSGDTLLSDLGITAGDFSVQGRSVTLSRDDVDPNSGITLGDLLGRINEGQSSVRAHLQTDFRGTRVVFDLYNPPDKFTEIEVLSGTSNALSQLGLLNATNTDAAARATYQGALFESSISVGIREDNGTIAAAGEIAPGEFGGVGDNQGALAIADLQDRLDLFTIGGSFDGFYNATVSSLGSRSQGNQRAFQNQGALTEQANNQRLSVSGVNLDEEAVELIKYQKAYEASARVISTFQTIYDTILSIVR